MAGPSVLDSSSRINLHPDISKEKRRREKQLRTLLWSLALLIGISILFLNIAMFVMVYEAKLAISVLVVSSHSNRDVPGTERRGTDQPSQPVGAVPGNSQLSAKEEGSVKAHRSKRGANIESVLQNLYVAVQDNGEKLQRYHLNKDVSQTAPNINVINHVGSGPLQDDDKLDQLLFALNSSLKDSFATMNHAFVTLRRENEMMTEQSLTTFNQTCGNAVDGLIDLKTREEELKTELLTKLNGVKEEIEGAVQRYVHDNLNEILREIAGTTKDTNSQLAALKNTCGIQVSTLAHNNSSIPEPGPQQKELSEKNQSWQTPSNLVQVKTRKFCMKDKGCKQINGKEKCFMLITDAANWSGARNNCQAIGGHLAEILDAETLTHIKSLGLKATTWLGANDLQSEGEFRWDRSGLLVEVDGWASGEPNNQKDQEHCLQMHEHLNMKWNDGPCDEMRYHLCEREDDNWDQWE